MVHPPPPLQPPPQPSKRKPGAAAGTSAMDVFSSNDALQTAPQSMPAGVELTEPKPLMTTLRRCFPRGGGAARSNRAVTCLSASATTSQEPLPEHAPLHPMKFEPASGCALSARREDMFTAAEQVAPQSISPAPERTRPLPFPVRLTVTFRFAGTTLPGD